MTLYIVPISIFIFLSLYVFFSLRIAWNRIGTQNEPSTSQSERAYKAFEFFFTGTIAIMGGIGYLRIEVMGKDNSLARQGMIFLAVLQNVSMGFLIIAVTSHLGSKWERWTEPNTKRDIKTGWWRMVEPWMIILSFVIGVSVWFIANTW
jgi:hypothetical protein